MNHITIYANFLKRFLNPKRKLKVVFDCSNGTTGMILKRLKIKDLRFKIINDEPDGNFPAHGPNPWAEDAMNQLKKEVLRRKADLGIIFDADGDRVFFVDNLGHVVEPDVIARLLIWQLQPKKVVFDIRASWLVKKIQDLRFKIYESRVGHFYIKKLMRKTGADLGVEKSGHYYFALRLVRQSFSIGESLDKGGLSYFDAGILTAIEIINAVSKLPYSLAYFSDLLPQYYRSGEINVKINNKLRIRNYKSLLKKIEKYFKSKTTNPDARSGLRLKHRSYKLDGLTMEFEGWLASRSLSEGGLASRSLSEGGLASRSLSEGGLASRSLSEGWWFNIRPSNTEPLIRLNIEAESQKILEEKKKELMNFLKNIGPKNN